MLRQGTTLGCGQPIPPPTYFSQTMTSEELLTAPASSLTRKQRRERAALKRQLAATMGLPPGYEVGAVRCRSSLLPGVEQVVVDEAQPVQRAIELGKLDPRGGHVMVRMLDQAPYAVGKP